jgi:fatty-acyl-CoA synthase
MKGLMMDRPLVINSIMEHAEHFHANREIVSVTYDNPRHRYTYADAFSRVRQLANVLANLGANIGDRIATLAWNDYRHLEIYYATSCSGLVCHTINPRLFEDQLSYIINHAGDKVLFTDPAFIPLLERLAPKLDEIPILVVLSDKAHMPTSDTLELKSYEVLLEGESDQIEWPELDENTASSLCYTSGTTGNPKGVLSTHRATVLHAYAEALPDVVCLSCKDSILPVVPMFHANAWGVAHSAPMVGAKLVFPGPKMADGQTLHDLMEKEQVTLALGVPTVWLALLDYLRENDLTLTTLNRTVVGGAACPAGIMDEFRERYGVNTHHAWGMTELNPLGTLNSPTADWHGYDENKQAEQRVKQGRGIFGIELKIVDDEDVEQPWDGQAFGALKVRGAWVCSDYYKLEGESDAHDEDGWFDTGDVASIDEAGFMKIVDRSKDLIKSGGEWISSIDVENIAMSHPGVQEAAVIGVPDDKWTERPLLVVVPRNAGELNSSDLLDHFSGKIAQWSIPEKVRFVDELPHTATGKISKLQLRRQIVGS